MALVNKRTKTDRRTAEKRSLQRTMGGTHVMFLAQQSISLGHLEQYATSRILRSIPKLQTRGANLRPSLVRTPERIKIRVAFAKSIGSDSIACRSAYGVEGRRARRRHKREEGGDQFLLRHKSLRDITNPNPNGLLCHTRLHFTTILPLVDHSCCCCGVSYYTYPRSWPGFPSV